MCTICSRTAIAVCRASRTTRNPSRRTFIAPSTTKSINARLYSTTSPLSRFSYHIAASYNGKERPYDPSSHVFHFNPHHRIQPPKDKRKSSRPESGHDAFFVSRVNDSGSVAFGVADGVGGWVDSGVDPADFSHGLCDYMASAAYEAEEPLTARNLMQKGYDAICHDRSVKAGGSTACVAIASSEGQLDVANLGDSGFLQLRLNAIHAASEPQTHAFNTPYQLSLVPPEVAARAAAFGGGQLSDLPRDADVSRHRLRHGDVLLFVTDGVLDNLFPQDILKLSSKALASVGAWQMTEDGAVRVSDGLDELVTPQEAPEGTNNKKKGLKSVTLQSFLATSVVSAARLASINSRLDGPFAKEVQRYYPQENWHGGKVDDICAVAVVVSEEAEGIASKL